MNADEAMRHILELDSEAAILLSTWTGKWYVQARVEIGGDGFLTSPVAHRDDPAEAVTAFLEVLADLPRQKFVVTHWPTRRHRLWNGAGWLDLAVPDPMLA